MDSRQCQVCGEVFLNTHGVMSHIGSHSRKEIYECLLSLKSSLEIFMKQYFGLKDFVQRNTNQKNDNCDQNGHTEDDPDRSWNSSLSRAKNNHIAYPTEVETNFVDGSNEFQHEIAESKIASHGRKSMDDVNTCIDLTNIEIKTEIDDSSEIYNTNVSENVPCNGFNSVIMEDNSFAETYNHDSFSYNSERKDLLDKMETLQPNAPVSVIDLSHNEENIRNCRESDTYEIQQNKAISLTCVRNKVSNNPDSMYLTHKNGNNKTHSKPVTQNLTGKTIQMLAQELTNKSQHMTQGHSGTTCLDCGRTFSTKFVLRRHMMSHTGERTHNCPICGKGFIGKQNMMVHLRVHTGEKPYKCPYCGQQFTQYGTLYRHKKRHVASGDIKNITMLRSEQSN